MSDDENNHEPTDTRMRFDELALYQPILKAVQKAGYENPSPIQERAIPPLLEGSDFIGVAQTGTGKTAAFALPLLTRMDESVKGAQILVLAPTLELALQVAEAIEGFAENLPKLRVSPFTEALDTENKLANLNGVLKLLSEPQVG